jgi:hypothetical protein
MRKDVFQERVLRLGHVVILSRNLNVRAIDVFPQPLLSTYFLNTLYVSFPGPLKYFRLCLIQPRLPRNKLETNSNRYLSVYARVVCLKEIEPEQVSAVGIAFYEPRMN